MARSRSPASAVSRNLRLAVLAFDFTDWLRWRAFSLVSLRFADCLRLAIVALLASCLGGYRAAVSRPGPRDGARYRLPPCGMPHGSDVPAYRRWTGSPSSGRQR